MGPDTIRVLLADDYAIVRAGLKAVLASARDIQIVGEASTGREAVELAARERPDVVVMDLSMPDMDGTAATKEIAALDLGVRVLVLTMHDEEDFVARVMEAGAAGYLVKTSADRDLVGAVRCVAYGDVYLSPKGVAQLAKRGIKQTDPNSEKARFELLTAREREVVRLTGLGYSAPEIGAKLSISPKTVDTYKHRIHEKVDLAHRSDYVQFAFKLGLLTPA
jgi:two-component system, NarL family, response regulator NreC